MIRTTSLLLLVLTIPATNVLAEQPKPPAPKVTAFAGGSWAWVYLERERDVIILTIPVKVNEGKQSGKIVVAEAKTEVAALVTGPAAVKHAQPKPPFFYHYRNTVPDDGKHKIIAAASGVIEYSFAPNESRDDLGGITCDITNLEFPGGNSVDKLHVTSRVFSFPP